MSALRLKLVSIIFLIALSLSCEKNIYEGNLWSNDLLHGDIVSTVKQSDSGAKVFVSQVEPIDQFLQVG